MISLRGYVDSRGLWILRGSVVKAGYSGSGYWWVVRVGVSILCSKDGVPGQISGLVARVRVPGRVPGQLSGWGSNSVIRVGVLGQGAESAVRVGVQILCFGSGFRVGKSVCFISYRKKCRFCMLVKNMTLGNIVVEKLTVEETGAATKHLKKVH